MSKSRKVSKEMKPDYKFDYTRARPNRFASRLKGNVVAVVLEPDVAKVFDNSESVNRLLRSVISAVPVRPKRTSVEKRRRKLGWLRSSCQCNSVT